MAGGVRIAGLWQSYQPWATGARRGFGFRREREPRWALKDVSLRVEPGERLGLVGPNGAGKSTLLASIAGVLAPSRGTVALDGRVAAVIEPEIGLHRDFNGREHLMVAGVLLGMRRRELRERIPAILELSGIGEQALEKPLRTYSTGMVARLEFALAMRSDASVVVLDEHLGAVDESFRARLAAGLDELAARGGSAVLASHDLDLVKDLCDRAALVERGSLTDVGPAAEIVDGYARRRATAGLAAVPPEQDRAAAIG